MRDRPGEDRPFLLAVGDPLVAFTPIAAEPIEVSDRFTLSTGGAGNPARMADNSSLSHGWSTILGQCDTPLTRTCPLAG